MEHNNQIAEEGVDRCDCGSKYWENDRCVDCGGHVTCWGVQRGHEFKSKDNDPTVCVECGQDTALWASWHLTHEAVLV